MHIVQIASELAPVAKVGGLGDVIYGLSKELVRLGHEVEIIIPKYDCIDFSRLEDLKILEREISTFDGKHTFHNTVWSAELEHLKVLLIESHHPLYFFNRGVIYGCHDDIDRFAYFSRTAMEYLHKAKKKPDVIHVHDWPTALVPVLYKEVYHALGFCTKKTMITLHNMEHQGKCSPLTLSKVGLEHPLEKLQDPYTPSQINLLKGGIEYADSITTVSPTYEHEIQTPSGGLGLQETLIKHKAKLKGILNGIDEQFWNPEKDPYLVKKYPTGSTLAKVLEGKKENKNHLRTHLQLKNEERPLVACITRIVPQKSPELIKHALRRTLEKGGQFILLGTTPIPQLEGEFQALSAYYQDHPHVRILLDKDEALAHLIYAAADMFIIPSLFEPCGLTQLISFRYGTVPIARLTGGLVDTVFDIDTSAKQFGMRNGFTFEFPDAEGVNWALDRAIECYTKDKNKWHALMTHGISQDYSWKHTAPEYVELYLPSKKKALSP